MDKKPTKAGATKPKKPIKFKVVEPKTKPKPKMEEKKKVTEKPKKKINFKVKLDLKEEAKSIGEKITKLDPKSMFFNSELGKLMPKYYEVMDRIIKTGNSKMREKLEKILGRQIALQILDSAVINNIVPISTFSEKQVLQTKINDWVDFNSSKIFS